MIAYWLNLLVAWREKDRTGLTIPYLIGSQNYIDGTKQQSIEELISDISKGCQEIYLSYCPHINELILGLKKGNYGNFNGEFLKTDNTENSYGKLYVSKIILNNTRESNIEEIIDILYDKYSFLIENRLFSKNEGEWGDYTEDDLKFIKENS